MSVDSQRDPKAGEVWRGPRQDGRIVCLNILRGKPRLLVSDGQFTYPLTIAEFRKWAATAEVIRRAEDLIP